MPKALTSTPFCPEGTICFTNITFILIICIILAIGYMYLQTAKQKQQKQQQINDSRLIRQPVQPQPYFYGSNMFSFSEPRQPEVYGGVYNPPLKQTQPFRFPFFQSPHAISNQPIAINVDTSAINAPYTQVGFLTPINGKPGDIFPLMGRQRYTSRDKWQYYTISNTHGAGIKLPISVGGKSATTEYGVNEVSNGDTVYVEGYSQAMRVTVYDNDTIRYI
jgi:hypothetical protein